MPRLLSFCLLCTTLLLGACLGVDGNGHRVRERREHVDFVRVESDGPYGVQVEQGDSFSVVVSLDSNLIDHLDTWVEAETLYIHSDVHVFDMVSGPHVIVRMPNLGAAVLNGSGWIDASDFDEAQTVRLELNGSGQVSFHGSAPQVEAALNGSGDMQLSGTTDVADLEISGSGTIDARQLNACRARMRVSGSGDIESTVDGPAEVVIDGSGDIDLYGDVRLQASHVSGSGDVHLH